MLDDLNRPGLVILNPVSGDGTVSEAADGLAGSDFPLVIIANGTGNLIAQELGIPLEPDTAWALLIGSPTRQQTEGLKIGDQHLFLHTGLRLESETLN